MENDFTKEKQNSNHILIFFDKVHRSKQYYSLKLDKVNLESHL